MTIASGGKVWDLPGGILPVATSKKILKWFKWAAGFGLIGFTPTLLVAYLDFEVWRVSPSGLTSIAGGYVNPSTSEMSFLNFLLYFGVVVVSWLGVMWWNEKIIKNQMPFISFFSLMLFAVLVSLHDNESAPPSESINQWAKDTYGYEKILGEGVKLNTIAVSVLKEDGTRTTANVLRSDGNVYLYENVIQEEELIQKIKEAKSSQK